MTETLTISVGELIIGIIVLTVGIALALMLTYFLTRRSAVRERQQALKQSRATIKGQLSEQVAPLLPGFPEDLKATEAKFLGKPVDFVFFKGMDEENITEIVFLEVKTGKSPLNRNERKLRDAINEKKVQWREYRVPQELTAAIRLPISISAIPRDVGD